MRAYFSKHQGWSLSALFLIAFSILTVSDPVYASKGGEIADKTRVVALTPDELPSIKGSRISAYSLAAVSGGRMSPIPFQFDEKTQNGYIYMKNLEKKLHEEDPLSGTEGYFDEKDELIFMLKDAGSRKKSGMATDGKLIAEIEVEGWDKRKLYVYLMEDARVESENYYVRYSSVLGRVETDYYALQVNPKNAFMWQEFYYDSFDGAHPRKPVDTIKLRMKTNAIGAVPVTVFNKHMVAKAIDEKSGPIRSTTEYQLSLTYLKTPLLNMRLQIIHHEHEIIYDAQVAIPQVRRRLIAAPEMKLTLDGYELQGASVRVQNGPEEAGIVDGEISEIETQLLATPIETGKNVWLWMDSHYNFMILSNMNIYGEEPVPLEFVYEDEKETDDGSEYYKGQSPNLGVSMKIPLKGALRVIVPIKMFSEELDIDAEEFANYVETKPVIRVSKL